jgi:hypothetical protein
MTLFLANLDRHVRDLMLTELDIDLQNHRLYVSPRLSRSGVAAWEPLLRRAADAHGDEWLAAELRKGPHFNTKEQRRTPQGGFTWADIPETAASTLAEGEYNRLYMRALCLLAIAEGIPRLLIYRAKEVARPRPESEERIGTTVDPKKLLEDLRTHQGIEAALALPPGPNSGLSVRLP